MIELMIVMELKKKKECENKCVRWLWHQTECQPMCHVMESMTIWTISSCVFRIDKKLITDNNNDALIFNLQVRNQFIVPFSKKKKKEIFFLSHICIFSLCEAISKNINNFDNEYNPGMLVNEFVGIIFVQLYVVMIFIDYNPI